MMEQQQKKKKNKSSISDSGAEQGIGKSHELELSAASNDAEDRRRKKHSGAEAAIPLHKLFSFADSADIVLMVLGFVGSLSNGIISRMLTIIMGDVINVLGGDTLTNQAVHRVSKICQKIVYMGIGAGTASFLQVSCWMVTGERQAARIRTMYLKALLKQDIAFFDMEAKTGKILGSMCEDTVLIQDAVGEKVGKLFEQVSVFFTAFIIAFTHGWLLTLVIISIVPVFVLFGAIISRVTTRLALRGQAAYVETSAIVQQTVSSIRSVATFTGEKLAVKKFEKALKNAYKISIFEGILSGVSSGFIASITYWALALGFWYGAKLIVQRGYNGGDVIVIAFSVLFGSTSLIPLVPCLSAFAKGRAAAYNMFETINRKPKIDSSDETGKRLDAFRGDIEFKNVYFSYPSRPEQNIFTGFSLFIHHGTTMALVGGSGSGKSTVISLIERFYDPQAGEVLIDGINAKQLQLRWLREKIGLVSQEPVLFASTIRANISYGKHNATVEEINAAIELSNASKFINMLPQGLNTMVGEQGTQLSGGQKQRIAIARAILKEPRILLLDEATSALDVESERVVQEALDRIMINRTTVIVAHRLSTVKNADTIVVMNQGSIVEKGTHSELQKDSMGAYRQLIQLQEMNRSLNQSPIADRIEDIVPAVKAVPSNHNSSLRQFSRRESFLRSANSSSFSMKPSVSEDKLSSKKHKQAPIYRLARLNKPESFILLLGSIAAVVNGVLYPFFAVMFSSMVKTLYEPPHKLKKNATFWSELYLMMGSIALVAVPVRSLLFAVAGAKLIRRIRLMTFKKVISMEMAWFDEHENTSGAIGARLLTDAATLRSLVGDAFGLLVQNASTLVCGLAIAFSASWQLSLIVLAVLPVIGLNGFVRTKFDKGFSANAKKMYEEAIHVVSDALGSMRTIASFSAEEKVMEMYKNKCKFFIKAGIHQGVLSGIIAGISNMLYFCVYAVIYYAGSHLMGDGKITFDQVFETSIAIVIIGIEISRSRTGLPDSNKALLAAGSIFKIIDRRSRIDPSDESGMTLKLLEGNIEFCHVNFKYPSRPNSPILRDLCLSIQSGKIIAFVGESGSGKSTLISLLQRFYDPDSGGIYLDGVELQKLNLRWLRQQMGLVSQEPMLFNDTIRSNIAYGKEDEAGEAEIIAAAELANAHGFISSLNQGYETMVGERGIQLSGGQKQRVAIVRAILKQPRILLLDEATSALDAESERIVQTALEQVMVNRTTIVVAHRLATIQTADLIAVIKEGGIVEQGTHEALLKIENGVYASLLAIHSTIYS